MTLSRGGLRDVTNETRPAQDAKPAAATRKTSAGPNRTVVKPEQKPAPSKKGGDAKQTAQATKAQAAAAKKEAKKDTAVEVVEKPRSPQKRSDLSDLAPVNRSKKAKSDPQQCADYANAVYNYLKEAEKRPKMRPSGVFVGQEEVTPRMRGILLDWLVEVHYKFKLAPETLYLCINLVDRYLAEDKKVHRKQLQLVGGTCMLIASKYEDFRPPEVSDFTYIMDSAYTREEVLDMEVKILNKLNFELTVPSPLQFLEHYIKVAGVERDMDTFFIAQYLIELTVIELRFQGRLPSLIAASALYLANRIKKVPTPWPKEMAEFTGFSELEEVKPLARSIFETVPEYRGKSSLYKKYSLEKYKAVAPLIPNH